MGLGFVVSKGDVNPCSGDVGWCRSVLSPQLNDPFREGVRPPRRDEHQPVPAVLRTFRDPADVSSRHQRAAGPGVRDAVIRCGPNFESIPRASVSTFVLAEQRVVLDLRTDAAGMR
jgi:hypothetical protein